MKKFFKSSRDDYVALTDNQPMPLSSEDRIADVFYHSIKWRFYRPLLLAVTMEDKAAMLNSPEFLTYIAERLKVAMLQYAAEAFETHRTLQKLPRNAQPSRELQTKLEQDSLKNIIDYFTRRHTYSEEKFEEKLYLMHSVQNALQKLTAAGLHNPKTQCVALMWASQKQVMLHVRPVFPKIDAVRETLLRLAALTIAETCINYVINLIDSWDGSADYPDVQKYLVPTMYVLTVMLILGKGVFDYRASRNACDKLESALNIDETNQTKFDSAISAHVISEAYRRRVEPANFNAGQLEVVVERPGMSVNL